MSGQYQNVWCIKLPNDASFISTSKTIALQETCAHILSQMRDILDDEPDCGEDYGYYEISDHIESGDYYKAISLWDSEYEITQESLIIDSAELEFLKRPTHDDDDDVQNASSSWSQLIRPTTTVCNDYTCATCGNTACSKTEKSCWRCGHPINP